MHRLLFALFLILPIGCEAQNKSDAGPSTAISAKSAANSPKQRTPETKTEQVEASNQKQASVPRATDCPDAPLVKFFDSALETEVRKKLQKPDAELRRADLKRVRSVNLTRSRVDYLDPCVFPQLSNLRQL